MQCFCNDGKLQWRMLLILVNEKLVTLFSFNGLLPEFHNHRPIFLLKILCTLRGWGHTKCFSENIEANLSILSQGLVITEQGWQNNMEKTDNI